MAKWKNKQSSSPSPRLEAKRQGSQNDVKSDSHHDDDELKIAAETDSDSGEDLSEQGVASEDRNVLEKAVFSRPVSEHPDGGVESRTDIDTDSSDDAGTAYYGRLTGTESDLDVEVGYSDEEESDVPEVTEAFLRQLPKAEIHCHLDGSVRVETILELAQQQRVKLPAEDPDSLRRLLVVGEDCRSLEDYLKAFEITLSVLQDAESLERVAYELVADAADENIRYLEVRYSPILHTRRGMRLTHIVDAVNDGLKRGEREFGVTTGVIICGMRNINPEISYQLAELAVAYKNRGVVAFDLAGAETDHPAKNHKEAFFLILRNNINCTLHAGESYGPESIHQALHYCGAHRIGHGTRLKEDGDLLNYVNDHRIPLEICLTSNVQTRATKSFGDHPLRFYYDYGLRTTINTDNRLMSDTTVSKELFRAHLHLGFELDELLDLIIFGFKSSFLPYRAKVKMLGKVYEELRGMNLKARTQKICGADELPERL